MKRWLSFFSAWISQLVIFGMLPFSVQSEVVSTCDEAGLRSAIAGGGTVTFACDGSIILTNTITITNSLILDGTNRLVTISGGNAVRIFQINSGATLTLRNLTLADGHARGTNGNAGADGGIGEGGAVFNNGGNLYASDCIFLRNKAMGGKGGDARNGYEMWKGGIGRGGAIYNFNGQVEITNSLFALNTAFGGIVGTGIGNVNGADALGGAVYVTGGSVKMVNCVVSSNSVTSGRGIRFGVSSWYSGIASGGAIYNSGGEVVLTGTTVSSNSCEAEYLTSAYGGAIHQTNGILNILDTLFEMNKATGGQGLGVSTPSGISGAPAIGGALYIGSGIARITNATFARNFALGGNSGSSDFGGTGSGGAIFNAGSLEMLNGTLSGNAARAGEVNFGPKSSAYGGALYNRSNSLLIHVTIAGNTASASLGNSSTGYAVSQGGGIYSTNGVVTLENTILAYNLSGSNCFGTTFTDSGNNISSDASCNFSAPGSLVNTDPILGPLGNYGGSTPTMPLLAGSPAIDGGSNSFCPPTDQRGIARPFGAACDIGAFESSPPYTIRGSIQGYVSTGMIVSANSPTAVNADGSYIFNGLSAGNYLIIPSASDAIFVASTQTVNVGPDALNVNFYSYRSNAFAIFPPTNNVQRLVFAGAKGQILEVQVSTNLINWSPQSTNTVEVNGLFEVFRTNNNQPEFFRSKEL